MDGRNPQLEVTRTLRLDTASFADALVGLRREMTGLAQLWSLGERGSFELDARLSNSRTSSLVRSDLTGRLWDPAENALVPVQIIATSDDVATVIALLPVGEPGVWFTDHVSEFRDLAHAAVDELCEALLFHAAQQRRVSERT